MALLSLTHLTSLLAHYADIIHDIKLEIRNAVCGIIVISSFIKIRQLYQTLLGG
jgi:hypothetical protein